MDMESIRGSSGFGFVDSLITVENSRVDPAMSGNTDEVGVIGGLTVQEHLKM